MSAAPDRTDAEPAPAPPPTTVGLGLGLGVLAAAVLGAGSPLSGAAALLAASLLGSALVLASHRLCSLAAAAFVLAIAAGGATDAPAAPLAVGAVLALAAWDVTDHGIDLGRQVGREAGAARNELVHAAGSLAIGGVGCAVALGAFLAAAGGQPATALVFLLVAAVALLVGLRR